MHRILSKSACGSFVILHHSSAAEENGKAKEGHDLFFLFVIMLLHVQGTDLNTDETDLQWK